MNLAAHWGRQGQWTWKCSIRPPKKGEKKEEKKKDLDWSSEGKKKDGKINKEGTPGAMWDNIK